jgi:alpha-N-arabinofuranosidase
LSAFPFTCTLARIPGSNFRVQQSSDRIVSTAETYRFSYAVGDESFQQLGEVETRYLSSEVADGFTGVFVGMFATGNGKDNAASADFDWFEYKRTAKTTSLLRMGVASSNR